jgi:hypothetical protein
MFRTSRQQRGGGRSLMLEFIRDALLLIGLALLLGGTAMLFSIYAAAIVAGVLMVALAFWLRPRDAQIPNPRRSSE